MLQICNLISTQANLSFCLCSVQINSNEFECFGINPNCSQSSVGEKSSFLFYI